MITAIKERNMNMMNSSTEAMTPGFMHILFQNVRAAGAPHEIGVCVVPSGQSFKNRL